MNASSGRWSHLPSAISSKLRIVSSNVVISPGFPVNTSATRKGWRGTSPFAGAVDDQFVLFAQFIHTENGDDILKFTISLERRLDFTGNVVMAITDILGIQNTA